MPIGYRGDPARSAATFVTVGGGRWALPGDLARVEADGTIVVLGRSSQCINTGGEKVYPEEVEAALKGRPDVVDAVVVGTPDERWGERVTAIVQPGPGPRPTLDELRRSAAGRRSPTTSSRSSWWSSTRCKRLPSGKADYAWAKAQVSRPVGRTRRRDRRCSAWSA